jgi:transcriptional regulator with XRE-family HTH domain
MNRVESVSEALGMRMRTERHRAGLTVRGLAGRVGVSPSLISQIERGRATPSVATLWSVADALGVSIAELFNEAEPEPLGREPTVRGPLQPHETRRVITLADGIRWERLTPLSDDELDFVLVVYPPGAASCPADALTRHGGREFGYVVSGTLAVEVGFDEHILRTNDSIAFDSSMPHRLRAVGDESAVAVWAVLHRHGDDRNRNFETAGGDSAKASISRTPGKTSRQR